MTSLQLAGALHGEKAFGRMLVTIMLALVPTQLPLGVLEGFLCVGAYQFIRARRPELLKMSPVGGSL
jgi:cobalt/nickel transport system permease protein